MAGFNLHQPVFLQHVPAQLPAIDTSRVQADHVGGAVVPALDHEAAGGVVAEYDQLAGWIVRVVPSGSHDAFHGRPGSDDEKLFRGRVVKAFFGIDARVDQQKFGLIDPEGKRLQPGDQGVGARCEGFQGLKGTGASRGYRGTGKVTAKPVRQAVVVVAEDHPRTRIPDQLPYACGIGAPAESVACEVQEIRIFSELQYGKQLFELTGTAVDVANEQGSQGDQDSGTIGTLVRTDGNDSLDDIYG